MAFPFDQISWIIRGRFNLSPPALNDGDACEVQTDGQGCVKVRTIGSGAASFYSSIVRKIEDVIKASPGRVFEVSGFNNSGSTRYVMIFNKATTPSNGDAPLYTLQVPAASSFDWQPIEPVVFGAGIAWASSTTPDSLTLSGSADVFLSAATS